MPLLTPDTARQLRLADVVAGGQLPHYAFRNSLEFIKMIVEGPRLMYCPTCEAMAWIGRLDQFRYDPFDPDRFSWKAPVINKEIVSCKT